MDHFWKQLEDQRREQAAKEQKALEMEQIKLKKDVQMEHKRQMQLHEENRNFEKVKADLERRQILDQVDQYQRERKNHFDRLKERDTMLANEYLSQMRQKHNK